MSPAPLTKFRDLPYNKADRVADLDAPKKVKARKPRRPAPSVPARHCNLAPICGLRKQGRCDAMHCQQASDYIAGIVHESEVSGAV